MVLRVATDCSGIEAPIWALRSLGVEFEHVWSAESDKRAVKYIKENHNPEVLFGDPDGPYPEGDITKRDVSVLPEVDLYVAGFPCQPFSHLNTRRKGLADPDKGNVFFACMDVIRTCRPRYFVLENVKGLLSHDKGRTWRVVQDHLATLERIGYRVEHRVLNTRLHAGLPQNRERVYIVGTRAGDIVWPDAIPMAPLLDYIDWKNPTTDKMPPCVERAMPRLEGSGLVILNTNGFLHKKTKETYASMNSGRAGKWCPCLCASNVFWVLPLHRRLNGSECLRLQGFDPSKLRGLSDSQARFRAGNSMTVPLLARLFQGLGIAGGSA